MPAEDRPLRWHARWPDFAQLMRLDRPVGIYLLLWPTLWALWLAADGVPRLDLLLVFVLGVVVMRSAGCVINDYADRHFDAHVERTRNRPLASGRVSPREALLLFGLLCAVAFGLVLCTDTLTVLLSTVGVALAVLYPFSKRVTHLPQLLLGAAFGWCIPMAYAAQAGVLPAQAWLLFAANLLWTVAYDTEYAMVDRADDLQIGIKSTAILFADYDRVAIGALHGLALAVLLLIGWQTGLGMPYYLGIAGAAALVVRQLWMIRGRDRAACLQAFKDNNYVGMTIFAGLALSLAPASG